MRIDTVRTDIFEFSELSEVAQQFAIDTARKLACNDSWWYEYTIDDAKRLAAIIGINIDSVYFSGFCSQGDGAQFTGSYSYVIGGTKELIKEAPQDSELHLIAQALQDIQRQDFYKLHARVKSSGHYSHSGCTDIQVYRETNYRYHDDASESAQETVAELLRDFMDWIYARLESEYDYQSGEECARYWLENCDQEYTINGSIY